MVSSRPEDLEKEAKKMPEFDGELVALDRVVMARMRLFVCREQVDGKCCSICRPTRAPTYHWITLSLSVQVHCLCLVLQLIHWLPLQ